jgi:hypothetical protein
MPAKAAYRGQRMSLETIAMWAGLFSAVTAVANFVIKVIAKKDVRREGKLFIRLIFIGLLGGVVGLIVWLLGAQILGGIIGYALGAIIASIAGAIVFSAAMIVFVKKDSQKGSDSKTANIITLILMSGVYWVIAWFALNDLYNNQFAGMSDSIRGIVSNVIGWTVACAIGNIPLLAISNFIGVLFKEDD